MIKKIITYGATIAALVAGGANAQQMSGQSNKIAQKLVKDSVYTVKVDVPGPGRKASTNASLEVAEDCYGAKTTADWNKVAGLPSFKKTMDTLTADFKKAGKDISKVDTGYTFMVQGDSAGAGHLYTGTTQTTIPGQKPAGEAGAAPAAKVMDAAAIQKAGLDSIAAKVKEGKRAKVLYLTMSDLKDLAQAGDVPANQLYNKWSKEFKRHDNATILYDGQKAQISNGNGDVYKETLMNDDHVNALLKARQNQTSKLEKLLGK